MCVRNFTDDEFIKIVQESQSFSDAMRKCGYTNLGNNNTIKKRMEMLKLDNSHFFLRKTNRAKKIPLWELLKENSTISQRCLKKRLLEELKWEYKCKICNQDEFWFGTKLTLELNHINGVNNDNRIENLRFLCPNCHSTTPTWRGRNNHHIGKQNKCTDCGKNIYKTSTRCNSCSSTKFNKRKIELRPTLEDITKDLKTMSYVSVGKKYGVSDNCIRKWIKINK